MDTPAAVSQPVQLDSQGHVILPADVAKDYALAAGGELTLRVTPEGILIKPSLTQLRKIYIEPTSRCNLACRTCIRNIWDEPLGSMSPTTFQHILEALTGLNPQTDHLFRRVWRATGPP